MQVTDIISQIRDTKPEALQYVYNHCREYCLRRLRKCTSCSPPDAEDIFMDAILIFRENVLKGKLTEVKYLRAYMDKICQNKYWEQQYNENRRRRSEDAVRVSLYDNDISVPDNMLQKKEIVMQAFRYLGVNCRCILQYYYFDHLTMQEIAKKTNMANANVAKVAKSRCYKKWVEAAAALKHKR